MIPEKEIIRLLEKAMIEAIVDNPDNALDPSTEPDPKSGAAWVKEGRIYVRDPADSGSPAIITPGPGVELYINGFLNSNQVQVSSTDLIEVKLVKHVHKGKCRIELTKDKMEALLIVEPTRIVSYELIEQAPQMRLYLRTLSKEKLKSPFDLDQFMKMLYEANVVVGVDLSEVKRVILSPGQAHVTVARGELPEPSVDERVEILFPQDLVISPRL